MIDRQWTSCVLKKCVMNIASTLAINKTKISWGQPLVLGVFTIFQLLRNTLNFILYGLFTHLWTSPIPLFHI